jgi:hypothetical protein
MPRLRLRLSRRARKERRAYGSLFAGRFGKSPGTSITHSGLSGDYRQCDADGMAVG